LACLAGLLLRRRTASRAQSGHLLTVYDSSSGQQHQELIPATDLVRGVALGASRLVPADSPEAFAHLGLLPDTQAPALFVTQADDAGPVLQVMLDGVRLPQVPPDATRRPPADA
jgi:hypothetical protein